MRSGTRGVWLALALAGIRYKVAGREHVPPTAVVFCSNHESNVDPPVLFEALHPQLHVLYKAELHKFPIMGDRLRRRRIRAVERGDRDKAMASICQGRRVAARRQLVPDLSRGHPQPHRPAAAVQEGRLHHGHPGPGADRARRRSRAAAPRCGRAARSSGRSTSASGSAQPIPTAGLTLDDRDALIAQVRDEVQKLLDEGSAVDVNSGAPACRPEGCVRASSRSASSCSRSAALGR